GPRPAPPKRMRSTRTDARRSRARAAPRPAAARPRATPASRRRSPRRAADPARSGAPSATRRRPDAARAARRSCERPRLAGQLLSEEREVLAAARAREAQDLGLAPVVVVREVVDLAQQLEARGAQLGEERLDRIVDEAERLPALDALEIHRQIERR